ncbi:hypothetical protein D9M72_449980 [compost metagenome]
MVECLLDLKFRVAPTVDHISVDHHKVRLLGFQGPVHQFDRATVRLLVVLGVVELDNLERAVRAEEEAWLWRLRTRRRLAAGRCGHGDSQGSKRSGSSQCRSPAEFGLVDTGVH